MLRMTEKELAEYQSRRACQKAAMPPKTQKKEKDIVPLTPTKQTTPQAQNERIAQKKTLLISIPGKLPTWNHILAAGVFKRKKIRDEIHRRVLDAVSRLYPTVSD